MIRATRGVMRMHESVKLIVVIAVVAVLTALVGCATTGGSVEDVFAVHHEKVETLTAEQADQIASDYADDAILILSDGTKLTGKEAIEAGFAGFLSSFPGLTYTETTYHVQNDTVLVMWKGYCDVGTFPAAVDTFLIKNGRIVRQTCWFEFVPKT
jgi:hypothetical protein